MNPPQASETCPKCGVERTYYDGWNCPTEGCDMPANLPPLPPSEEAKPIGAKWLPYIKAAGDAIRETIEAGHIGQPSMRDNESSLGKAEELLRADFINGLPQPLFADTFGIEWPIYDIEVGTGLVRIDVCGLLEVKHISDLRSIRDGSGSVYEIEEFYCDYVPDKPTGVEAREWQSIETAPRDGNVFLAFQPHDGSIGFQFVAFINGLGKPASMMTGDTMPKATHWMPLPPPPKP